jgi:hypothetical protein
VYYATFAWRQSTAQVLSLVIDWRMKAELVAATLNRIPRQMHNHLNRSYDSAEERSVLGPARISV